VLNQEMLQLETTEVISSAFEKSWRFVRTDPALAQDNMIVVRARLTKHLESLAQNGERDVLRLANSAIRQLRRERGRP
jgi:hypothetical protein